MKLSLNQSIVCAAAGLLCLISTAGATNVTVLPGDPNWGNPPGENGGGGHSEITSTAQRSGNGSLELFGDRTRFFGLGSIYDGSSNLGLLSGVSAFTFDWQIAMGSISNLDPDYTPALRLSIWDPNAPMGSQRSELVWEGAYNGTYGSTSQGVWYATGLADHFYKTGTSENNGVPIYDALAYYGYSAGAYVNAIDIGVGSTAGSGYHAFADDVTLAFGGNSTTYNFEVPNTPVPDSGTSLALLGLGVATLGAFSLRKGFAKA